MKWEKTPSEWDLKSAKPPVQREQYMGTVKDNKKNSLMWALINVVVCCNKEHMEMDVL